MIILSNGHGIEYMTASGALGYDGWGWPWEKPLRWLGLLDPRFFVNVMKTLTLPARRGNLRWYKPLGCIRPMRGGAVNAVGLTNPGPDWWLRKIGPKVDAKKNRLVGSIFGEPASLKIMARMLNDVDLVALELNASCPNTNSGRHLSNAIGVVEAVEIVREFSCHPIILKLSVAHNACAIAPAVEGAVEAISINSVPWDIAFPDRKSPLAKYGGGGVSGKIAQKFTWTMVEQLVKLTSVPVIGPSVWNFDDINALRQLGAKAVSFGSVFLCHPWRPTLFVRRDMKMRPT